MIEETKRISFHRCSSDDLPVRWLCNVVLFSAMLTTIALPVCAADGQFIPHNTPTYVATAKNLGAKDSSQTIDVSIWLNPHNRVALDALASELYNPNSSSYRHWLKSSDIAFRFAPTAAEAKVVQDFLESNKLKVVSMGANNFYVRARGTVADAENAFHVQLNDYQVGGNAVKMDASEGIADIPMNRSLFVQKLTANDPVRPEAVYNLKTVEEKMDQFAVEVLRLQEAGPAKPE